MFKAITEAFELLSNVKKRREFDSLDDFDDSIPSSFDPEDEDFIQAPMHPPAAPRSPPQLPTAPHSSPQLLAAPHSFPHPPLNCICHSHRFALDPATLTHVPASSPISVHQTSSTESPAQP